MSTLATLSSAGDLTYGVALTSTTLYAAFDGTFAGGADTIDGVSLSGGGVSIFASGVSTNAAPWAVAADDAYVFWTNQANGSTPQTTDYMKGSIWSKPLGGGAAKKLFGGNLVEPRTVTSDGKDAYFFYSEYDAATQTQAPARIGRAPRGGGTAQVVVQLMANDLSTRLFVDDGFIFFCYGGVVYKVAKLLVARSSG